MFKFYLFPLAVILAAAVILIFTVKNKRVLTLTQFFWFLVLAAVSAGASLAQTTLLTIAWSGYNHGTEIFFLWLVSIISIGLSFGVLLYLEDKAKELKEGLVGDFNLRHFDNIECLDCAIGYLVLKNGWKVGVVADSRPDWIMESGIKATVRKIPYPNIRRLLSLDGRSVWVTLEK